MNAKQEIYAAVGAYAAVWANRQHFTDTDCKHALDIFNTALSALVQSEREDAARAEREAAAKCVPTNWLDPLMDRKFGSGADGRAIEALLLCIAERIRSRVTEPQAREEGK